MNKLQQLKDLLTEFLFPPEFIDTTMSIAAENVKSLPPDANKKYVAHGAALDRQKAAKKYAYIGTIVRNARKSGMSEEQIAELKRLEKEKVDNE